MRYLLALVFLILTFRAYAIDWEESGEIAAIFKGSGISGTFVLYDVTRQQLIGHNKTRAETRYIPASTFKIAHSLIGLAVGAVKNVDVILPYGGQPQPLKSWEKDMGLREAITLSNVPIYQSLARLIGSARMNENLSKLGYGNGETGTSIDTFWLNGPLKISAVEQTHFLAKLAHEILPFPRQIQKSVREIVLMEQGENWALYGKTGWENAPNRGVGWWVGWVQKGDYVYAFALNMDMQQASDATKRIELGKASLKALGILGN